MSKYQGGLGPVHMYTFSLKREQVLFCCLAYRLHVSSENVHRKGIFFKDAFQKGDF